MNQNITPSVSIQYKVGNQMRINDMTKGKGPFFFSMEIGDHVHMWIDQEDAKEFVKEMSRVLASINESIALNSAEVLAK